jgi:putative methionine-R-sulfoxide reductase with GAF domain
LATAFLAANADEGTVWLVDPSGESLVAQYNSGPNAGRIVGFSQPLGSGLISMVFETEQAFCENEVQRNDLQDKRLDRHLGKATQSLIAVPFSIGGATCGVISCVRLGDNPSNGGRFTGKDLDLVTLAAEVFQDAVERALAP